MCGRENSKHRELNQTMSMRGRAYSKKPRTQANNANARARAFKNTANSMKQNQCEGARIQTIRELTQTRSMRGRAFNRAANSSKQGQCSGARIQQNRELKQRMSMCGRAHSKTTRTQANNINVKAQTFNEFAKSSKQY